MLDIFTKFFDLILPTKPAVKLLMNEKPTLFLRLFSPRRHLNTVVLSDYANPKIRAAITTNKFNDYDKASTLLAVLVNHWLITLPDKPTFLVPIPLSARRLKERGYNQVERVLHKTDGDLLHLLSRTKHTIAQTKLTREKRFTNVKDVFAYTNTVQISPGSRVVIVDDVITTGATLLSARAALAPHLPKDCELYCLAIAH